MATIQFWSQRLFEKTDKVKISYGGIARKCHVTERSAKNYIRRDIESGLIVRQRNRYTHPVFKRMCDGRNTYLLTNHGRGVLRKEPSPPSSGSSSKGNGGKLLFLELSTMLKTGKTAQMPRMRGQLPEWWFKDLQLLKKTLQLLSQKIKQGYRLQNPIGWVSSALKDQGCGYRQKVAQNVFEKLQQPTSTSAPSESIKQFYARLRDLQEKGLDTSVPSLKKLLRKGFAHLGSALCALEKLQTYDLKIENLTAFLNYLVSLKDPHSVYRKAEKRPIDVVIKARKLLLDHQGKIQFLSDPKELPAELSQKKTYLQFLIHKVAPSRSLLKVFQQSGGVWKEKVLRAIDPLFIEKIQTLVCNH